MADGRYARETRSPSSRDIVILRFSKWRPSAILNFEIEILNSRALQRRSVSIVGCRLDYCNSVAYGMSQANIDKLQCV